MVDKTEPGQDTPVTPDPSAPGEGTTSPPAASKDADKNKELNDRLSAQGRTLKTLEEQNAQLTTERDASKAQVTQARADVEDLRKQVRELRRGGVRDDPAALKLFQAEEDLEERERKLRDSETALTTRETSVTAREMAIAGATQANRIAEIAKDYGVDEKELTDLGITDPDTLKRTAQALANRGKPRATAPGARAKGAGGDKGEEPEPASVDGAGAATPSVEQLDEMPVGDYFATRRRQDPTLTVG